MEWYYVLNGEQVGPVSTADLTQLKNQGFLDEASLLWREGMADWQTMGQLASEFLPPPSAVSAPSPIPATTLTPEVLPSPTASSLNPYAAPVSEATTSAGELDWSGRGLQAVMKQTFHIFGQHFGLLMASFLIVWAPLNGLIEYFLYNTDFGGDEMKYVMMQIRLTNVAEGLFGIIAVGAVLTICNAAWDGESIGFGRAIAGGFTNWGRLWFARFILGFCLIGAFIALVLPLIWVAVRLSLIDQVVIREKLTGTDAIRRTWDLTRGKFWPILGYVILGTIPIMGMGFMVGIPLGFEELDTWWVSAIGSCIIGLAEVFLIIFLFVIFQHYVEDEIVEG